MDTSPANGAVAEQLPQFETSDSHYDHEELLSNNVQMSEADVSEAVDGSADATLQEALQAYNHFSDALPEQEQQHRLISSSLETQHQSSSPVLAGSESLDLTESMVPTEPAVPSSSKPQDELVSTADQAVFDPYSFQADISENGMFHHRGSQDMQVSHEHHETAPEMFDSLRLSETLAKDDFGVKPSRASPRHGSLSQPDTVQISDGIISLGLSKYQPSAIPAFKGRSKSASPPPSEAQNNFSVMANWPPPNPATAGRVDVFPPDNAPLHVWIQAYALRWGVWAAEIEDEAVRDRVLGAVTEKMKVAWETAIQEGYYLKPDSADVTSDQEKGESDAQNKRGRKRAQSPSKVSAGFTCEGKDKFAITNGELAKHGITMEMINQRVESKDFDVGELRYDEVSQNMNSDVITMRDWSASIYGSIQNRNLLMYCFWVVQEERKHLARLTVLYNKFSKDHQKRNTKIRMDGVKEREHQHMALATELTLLERRLEEIEDDKDHATNDVEVTPVNLTSEAENDIQQEPESSEKSDVDASLGKTQVLELAHAVFVARTEADLYQAFTSRSLRPSDITVQGTNSDVEDNELRTILAEILTNIEHSIRISKYSKTRQPSEVIKLGHDNRLVQAKIGELRQQLPGFLRSLSQLPHGSESVFVKDEAVSRQTMPRTRLNTAVPKRVVPPSDEGSKLESSDEDGDFYDSTEGASEPVSNGLGQQIGSSIPPPQFDSSGGPSQVTQPSDVKRLYITERWIPLLNQMLAKHNLPLVSEPIGTWGPIRDILQQQLGFSPSQRNNALEQFKQRYPLFLREKGLISNDPKSSSPVPSVDTATSPALSNTSLKGSSPLDWPSDAEIAGAIPPQGIPAPNLLQMFGPRISTDRSRFIDALKRVSRLDESTYRVYPKQSELPPLNRQYDMLPPPPMPNSQAIAASRSELPSPARNKFIKLRLPQASSDSFSSLPPQDETNFPTEYTSTEVNTSRGFSFRHLPHATLEQRQRMDEIVDDYIQNTIRSRKKGRWGQYIRFTDPHNQSGPPIAHGFWDLSAKGERAPATEWFYTGQDMPTGWATDISDDTSHGHDQTRTHQNMSTPASTTEPSQPRLKLKVSKPTPSHDPQKMRPSTSAFSSPQQNFSAMQSLSQFGSYNGMPANFNCNNYPANLHHSQDFSDGHPATINPALLVKNPDQSSAGQAQDGKRGAKRGAPAQKAGGRKKQKRRATVVPDDDDDDEDYDPSQDY